MKSFPTALLISLTLLSPVAAIAEPAESSPESGTYGLAPADLPGAHGKRFMEERLAELHKELKLTEAQEADWKTWSATITQIKEAKRQARPDREALKKLPAPDRLEKMLEHAKSKQTFLEEALSATKTYYATLTPDQRKVFDDLTPFGERAPKWMHHGGRRHQRMQ